MSRKLNIVLAAAVVAALVAAAVGPGREGVQAQGQRVASTNDLIRDYYMIETAVLVSPHGLRKKMDKGAEDYVLVDVRSAQEYEKEHIVGAVNIPAYKDPDTSAYGDVERIVGAFRELPRDKEIIVYCYSIPCMTGRKIGKLLAANGIYVKHLGVGWNEWRYYWKTWNHEHEWDTTKPEDYVISGKEPGVSKKHPTTGCPVC